MEFPVPFTYFIGDNNPKTGLPLNTLKDCEQAVRDELFDGLLDPYIKLLTVEKEEKDGRE